MNLAMYKAEEEVCHFVQTADKGQLETADETLQHGVQQALEATETQASDYLMQVAETFSGSINDLREGFGLQRQAFETELSVHLAKPLEQEDGVQLQHSNLLLKIARGLSTTRSIGSSLQHTPLHPVARLAEAWVLVSTAQDAVHQDDLAMRRQLIDRVRHAFRQAQILDSDELQCLLDDLTASLTKTWENEVHRLTTELKADYDGKQRLLTEADAQIEAKSRTSEDYRKLLLRLDPEWKQVTLLEHLESDRQVLKFIMAALSSADKILGSEPA